MEVLTFSRIKARKNCPMAEHIRYDLELVPRNKKKSLGLGSAIHLGLETDDIDKAVGYFDGVFPDSQEEANELEVQRATVRAMLTGYFARFGKWGEETIRELSFDIPIRNPKTGAVSRSFRLQGKIDAITVIDGKTWLVEYKTASQINKGYFERVSLDVEVLHNGTRRYYWDFEYPAINNIAGFKMRYLQGSIPNWGKGFDVQDGLITSQPYETSTIRQGAHIVMIKAVNASGNESPNYASVLVNFAEPLEDNVLYRVDFSEDGWAKVETNGDIMSDGVHSRQMNTHYSSAESLKRSCTACTRSSMCPTVWKTSKTFLVLPKGWSCRSQHRTTIRRPCG